MSILRYDSSREIDPSYVSMAEMVEGPIPLELIEPMKEKRDTTRLGRIERLLARKRRSAPPEDLPPRVIDPLLDVVVGDDPATIGLHKEVHEGAAHADAWIPSRIQEEPLSPQE